ncbi:hypothetical protein CLV43_107223 [Umezawaea tangerina]|uniref:Uncharacterized protein n=1 Tax=Umezawaea tangerina TaxID=84725 RepID=A0A2T0T1V1_9PSEU|nr:hypothetical protein CLV43_107223 [Umezawaea tangerina]
MSAVDTTPDLLEHGTAPVAPVAVEDEHDDEEHIVRGLD